MIKLSPITKGLLFGFIILLVSLGSGMIGFKYFCPITWHDAFLNAAMLLTGMGPVDEPTSNAGKVFAGVYALYSGIVFLSLVGIMTIPIFLFRIQTKSTHVLLTTLVEITPITEEIPPILLPEKKPIN